MKTKSLLAGAAICMTTLSACGGDELIGMDPASTPGEPTVENLAQTSSELVVTNNFYNLPYRGGYGGFFANLDCPGGYVAVGIFGRAGKYIDRMGVECRELRVDGSLGLTYRTLSVGGGGGGDFNLRCRDGEAVVGLFGGSGKYVDRLGLSCAKPSDWLNNYLAISFTMTAGGTGGDYFDNRCSMAYMVTSLTVNSDKWVDGVQARCNWIN